MNVPEASGDPEGEGSDDLTGQKTVLKKNEPVYVYVSFI